MIDIFITVFIVFCLYYVVSIRIQFHKAHYSFILSDLKAVDI